MTFKRDYNDALCLLLCTPTRGDTREDKGLNYERTQYIIPVLVMHAIHVVVKLHTAYCDKVKEYSYV